MITTKNIEQMLSDEGFIISTVQGRSMLPMLTQGKERILIVPPVFPLKLNTVALYKVNGVYVLHRVIGFEPEGYLIRGDNTVVDEHVKESKVLGMLSGFWRGEEYIECTEEFNAEMAARSKKTLPYRKVKHFFYDVKYRLAKFKNRLLRKK